MFFFFWGVDTYPICTMYNDLALFLSPDKHSNLGIPVILNIALKLRQPGNYIIVLIMWPFYWTGLNINGCPIAPGK
jgi:hypothetical protein